MSDSDVQASVFKEANCFKGGHCLLFVHGDETSRILQNWMENIGMKVWLIPQVELIASTLEKVHSTSISPSRTRHLASIATAQTGVSAPKRWSAKFCQWH